MDKYEHQKIEQKWQKKWAEDNVDKNDKSNHDKEKFFMLDMLPYPSGDGLHMGHTESYTASDIMYRFKRMHGYHVLHPQAFDSFGLPAENYAIKTGVHPSETTVTNGENYIRQMKSLGLGYDYDDMFYTSSPDFYRWTQWFFSRFFENDLIYRKTQTVNWCPSCNTTLANEQVEQGECERCKSEVIQKEIPTWSFRITNYADELIDDLSTINWPEHTKKNQTNWVGRSQGSLITFKFKDTDLETQVFTTRADTLFGATFLVLAPENPLVKKLGGSSLPMIDNWDEVDGYVNKTGKKTELERMENKEKTGVRLEGVHAINPANGAEIPVFIADYVLAGYGTGAVMAVPAHDERDNEFAKKFGLNITRVVSQLINSQPKISTERTAVYGIIKDGEKYCIQHFTKLDFYWWPGGGLDDGESLEDGLRRELKEELGYTNIMIGEEINTIAFDYSWGDLHKLGHDGTWGRNHMHIFDVHVNMDEEGETNLEPNEIELEIKVLWLTSQEIRDRLAKIERQERADVIRDTLSTLEEDTQFTGYGIAVNSGQFDGMPSEEAKKAITEFVGGEMTNTYRLKDWSISRQRYWGCPIPVVYDPEGTAHLVPDEHLPWLLPTDVDFVPKGTAPLADSRELIERTEAIFGKGWRPEVDTMDTFVCSSWYFLRYADPMNTAEWCSKANKQYWQPVDLYIGGAEHTYMHLLYARFWIKAMKTMGMVDYDEPFTKLRHQGYVLDAQGKKMSKSKGNVVNPDEIVERFGADAVRLYMMFAGPLEDEVMWNENGVVGMYRFIEKVWRQQEKLSEELNIDITKIVHKTIKKVTADTEELRFNTAISTMMVCVNTMDKADSVNIENYQAFIKLLSVFAPHVAQEILSTMGRDDYVSDMSWPGYDIEMAVDDQVELAVQVNGKMRGKLFVSPDASEGDVLETAQKEEGITKWLSEGEIKKVIYVPGRILNIIVS